MIIICAKLTGFKNVGKTHKAREATMLSGDLVEMVRQLPEREKIAKT